MNSAPSKGGDAQEGEDGSIMGSIAALKNILMIDTPTKSILSRGANISLQQTRYEERRQYDDEIESLKTALGDLESKRERLTQEFEKEKSVRKTLETTYGALLKHKKELMVHMELLKNSRGKLEDELASNVISLRSTKRSMEESNKDWEKQVEALKGEKAAALDSASDFENKYKESRKKVQDLEETIAQLKTEIEQSNQRYEETVKEHSRLQQLSAEKLAETATKLKTTETVVRFSLLWCDVEISVEALSYIAISLTKLGVELRHFDKKTQRWRVRSSIAYLTSSKKCRKLLRVRLTNLVHQILLVSRTWPLDWF
jgi:chromosome segregation ATPase